MTSKDIGIVKVLMYLVVKQVGQEYKVSLLHDTDEVQTETATNLYMQELGGSIFFAAGDTLKVVDSPLTDTSSAEDGGF